MSSCDPTIPIAISNSRLDTVTVVAETTVNFHTEDSLTDSKELGGTYDHRIVKFKMAPRTTIECGMAIAGIADEMPFTTFEVITKSDTLVASTQDKILSLFDQTFFGHLKTPYQLTIK